MRTAAADAAMAAGEGPVWLLTLITPSGERLRFSTAAIAVPTSMALDGPYA